MMPSRLVAVLGAAQIDCEKELHRIHAAEIPARIWRQDHTVWRDDPTEIVNRLGWLRSPQVMRKALPELQAFAEEVRAAGCTRVLLLGMGGSSLAPEVLARVFGARRGHPELDVLDSTDPGAVLEKAGASDPETTLYIVATKSGSTVETVSLMYYCYRRAVGALGREGAGRQFVAITDPGSSLQTVAEQLGFRRTFMNDPQIGGRYSALSYFGLVPAALIGLDLGALLDRALEAAADPRSRDASGGDSDQGERLGAILGAVANAGREKLTLICSPALAPFGAWVEQLVAESTGKDGRGILPVIGESLAAPESYADDRLFLFLHLAEERAHDFVAVPAAALATAGHPVVRIELQDLYDLGGEFFRWEMATAIAGAILGIQPFDQPDVDAAKIRAREMIAAYQRDGCLPTEKPSATEEGMVIHAPFPTADLRDALEQLLARAQEGQPPDVPRSYVAIQAYLHPRAETAALLQKLSATISRRQRLATTVGFGPRFLHSTGQLHKGDAGHGLFLQITAEAIEDVPIPDGPEGDKSSLTFGILEQAQAMGDRQALTEAGRTVVRVHLGREPVAGLRKLIAAAG